MLEGLFESKDVTNALFKTRLLLYFRKTKYNG